MMPTTPVWVMAGMDMITYRNLPWPEKKKLIVRHHGIGILPSCFDCGKGFHQMMHDAKVAAMPAELRNHPYADLFWAWRQHEAETFTIKQNTGGVL